MFKAVRKNAEPKMRDKDIDTNIVFLLQLYAVCKYVPIARDSRPEGKGVAGA